MQKESRLKSFLNDPARALWSMALPIIAGMMVQTLFNVVDIMFIGWLGADEVTAVAFVSPLFFIIIGLTVGLGAGVTASIAQYIGKKDKRNADNCAEHAILLGIVITVLLTILGVYFGRDLLILLGAYDHILDTAHSYLKILTFGIGGVVFSLFFRAILAGEGETTIPMIIGLVGTISNVILDPIFIFLLEYGVDGAAIATVLSQVIMLAMYFTVIFVMKKTFISFNFSHFRYTPNILNMIFKVGIPSSLSMLIISFGQAVLNKILINYSSETVAAYQIVSRIDMLLFMPCLGIAIALTTIVGMFFGAKEFSKLIWVVKYGISRAFMITIVNVAILFLSAEIILPIFTSNQEVLSIGITYLKIIVLVYPAVAVSVICARICQAFGQGMPLLVVTTIRVLVITAPLALYFYQTGKPVVWVWYSQVLAIIIATAISFLFLQYYLRKFHIVGDTSNS
tara:strand:- start:451 stop:1812 length:1362 start_codon:yes stop_codon:yes gene_type:complete